MRSNGIGKCRSHCWYSLRDYSNKTFSFWGKLHILALLGWWRWGTQKTVEIPRRVATNFFAFFFFEESLAFLSRSHLLPLDLLSPARCRWRPDTPRPSGGRCTPSWSRLSPRTTGGPGCLRTLLDQNTHTQSVSHSHALQCPRQAQF